MPPPSACKRVPPALSICHCVCSVDFLQSQRSLTNNVIQLATRTHHVSLTALCARNSPVPQHIWSLSLSHMTLVTWPATLSIMQCSATSYTTCSVWQWPVGRPRDLQGDWQLSIAAHCCSLFVFTGGGHCPLRPSAGHSPGVWPLTSALVETWVVRPGCLSNTPASTCPCSVGTATQHDISAFKYILKILEIWNTIKILFHTY